MDTQLASENFEKVALHLETETPLTLAQHVHSRLRRDELDAAGAFVQVPLYLRSIGGGRVYSFLTYEITPNAFFVVCKDPHKYPFRFGTTLLEGVIKFNLPDSREAFYFSFLGKMERQLDGREILDDGPTGFVLRIVQAGFDERTKLELFIESLRPSR